MVICGKLTRPKDHTRFGKLVYVCSDHQPDGKDMGVTEMIESRQTLEKGDKESLSDVYGLDNGGNDTDALSLTELEHSIRDEEIQKDPTGLEKTEDDTEQEFFSQSLLKRHK